MYTATIELTQEDMDEFTAAHKIGVAPVPIEKIFAAVNASLNVVAQVRATGKVPLTLILPEGDNG